MCAALESYMSRSLLLAIAALAIAVIPVNAGAKPAQGVIAASFATAPAPRCLAPSSVSSANARARSPSS